MSSCRTALPREPYCGSTLRVPCLNALLSERQKGSGNPSPCSPSGTPLGAAAKAQGKGCGVKQTIEQKQNKTVQKRHKMLWGPQMLVVLELRVRRGLGPPEGVG